MTQIEIKRFQKNFLFSGLSLAVKLFANVFIFLFIAKADFISPSQFGILNYAIGVGVTFTLLADYGIETYAIRDIASGRIDEKEVSYIFSFRVFLCLLSFLLFNTYFYLTNTNCKFFVFLIVLSFYLGFITRTVHIFFQAKESFYLETCGRIVEDLLLIILIFVDLYIWENFDYISYIFLFSRFLGFVFSYFLFYRYFKFYLKLSFDIPKFRLILRNSFSFALLTILPTLMINMDTILIKEFINASQKFINTQIGYYGAAVKIMIFFTFIATVFQKALLPQLSRINCENGLIFYNSISLLNTFILNLNIISAIFVYFYSFDIIFLLYGSKYYEAGRFLKLVAFLIILRSSVAYGLYFTILDKLKVRIYSSAILLIAFIVFSAVLIPKLNGIGALYAMIGAYICSWIYTLYQTYKCFGDILLGINKKFLFTNIFLFSFLLFILKPKFVFGMILLGLYISGEYSFLKKMKCFQLRT